MRQNVDHPSNYVRIRRALLAGPKTIAQLGAVLPRLGSPANIHRRVAEVTNLMVERTLIEIDAAGIVTWIGPR
jgi:hypothetical protein